MKTADPLRALISACIDDARTLRHETKFVDAIRASTLTQLASEREAFVASLELLGERGQRRPGGSWAELLREARRDAWTSAAGSNVGDAIASCRRSHARTESRYDEILRAPLTAEIKVVLTEQRRLLRDEANRLNQLQF